jgi:hypothetical protein
VPIFHGAGARPTLFLLAMTPPDNEKRASPGIDRIWRYGISLGGRGFR